MISLPGFATSRSQRYICGKFGQLAHSVVSQREAQRTRRYFLSEIRLGSTRPSPVLWHALPRLLLWLAARLCHSGLEHPAQPSAISPPSNSTPSAGNESSKAPRSSPQATNGTTARSPTTAPKSGYSAPPLKTPQTPIKNCISPKSSPSTLNATASSATISPPAPNKHASSPQNAPSTPSPPPHHPH